MGLREWWNRTKYRLGWEEITPFGECLYKYCKDLAFGKDTYIQAYEDALEDMWPKEMYPEMEYNRQSAAIAFVIYMNDNFYGWEETDGYTVLRQGLTNEEAEMLEDYLEDIRANDKGE